MCWLESPLWSPFTIKDEMVSCLQLADDSHDDNVEDDDFRATFDMDFFLRSTLATTRRLSKN